MKFILKLTEHIIRQISDCPIYYQIIRVNDGQLGRCNGLQTRQTSHYEWVWVSLGAPFMRPCVASKQKA